MYEAGIFYIFFCVIIEFAVRENIVIRDFGSEFYFISDFAFFAVGSGQVYFDFSADSHSVYKNSVHNYIFAGVGFSLVADCGANGVGIAVYKLFTVKSFNLNIT